MNPVTGRFADETTSDFYFAFPRHLEKQTYQVWDGYYGVMDFEFVAVEEIAGLTTYHFRYQTETLDETAYYVADEYILRRQVSMEILV